MAKNKQLNNAENRNPDLPVVVGTETGKKLTVNLKSFDDLIPVVATTNSDVALKRINETALALEGELGATAENLAIASLAEIAPKDGVESMLAAQMVATHEMAMIMLRRSVASKHIPEIESAVNLSTKLTRSFVAQMEALQRYRTKGQQKITVEHQNVTVESGGQAVIGDVHHGGGGKKEK